MNPGTMMRLSGCFLLSFVFFLNAFAEDFPRFNVEQVPEYDALFERSEGWTGADGAYTVALDNTTILWLFSDTWIGAIREGKHVDSTMINNSIGVQTGTHPSSATVEFFYNRKDGKPASLIEPVDGKGWYWLFDGALTGKGLYLFLKQVVKTGDGVFGFEHVATWLGQIRNPRAIPTAWEITQQKIPWEISDQDRKMQFGSAVLQDQGMVYIYGIADEKRDGRRHRCMILARVAEESLGDFAAWRFYTGGSWVEDFTQTEGLCDRVGSEFSVSYQTYLKKFMLVTTEDGMSKKVQIRSADHPWGPWGDAVTVYECPDGKWDSSYFTYAGKGHPMLSAANEMLFTYVCNSFDFGKMVSDARIYHPRFVRIRFDHPEGRSEK